MHNIELVRKALRAYEHYRGIWPLVRTQIFVACHYPGDFNVTMDRVRKAKHKLKTMAIVAHDRVLTGRNVQ